MKKITFITLILSLLLCLASCMTATVTPDSDLPGAVAPDSAEDGNGFIQTDATSEFIGVDEAKRIALEKAGLAESDVRFDRTELDNEKGVWVYEVEFETLTTEYDAEIKADDGTILKWETENN